MIQSVSNWPPDIESLLLPISEDRPAGVSLRHDDTYDRIKEARREDDPSLPQGVWQTDLKRADWRLVEEICTEALRCRSKDLQIGAWLLESWLHLRGIAGVEVGLRLLCGLCERFWPELHPSPNGASLDSRTSPIHWINEHLYLTLKRIPVTRLQQRDGVAYRWVDWETAGYLENLARKNPRLAKAEAERRVTKDRFREGMAATPTQFYVAFIEALDGALTALDHLQACLIEKCGDQSPSLRQFRGVLTDIRHLLTGALAERGAGEAEPPTEVNQEQGGGELTHGGTTIRSRAEAYQRLAAIADYLLQLEPHSPTPYLIKRAVSWGSMSLTDLLLELVGSTNDQRAIFELLGIKQEGA